MKLVEKYRPTCFDDVVGQDRVIGKIAALRRRGLSGRSFWIVGASGTGKTTIARIIAAEIADQFCTVEIDASESSIGRLRDIDSSMYTFGMGNKSGRAYIVNEAHGLRSDVIRKLLVLLEDLPEHCVFIFTTTTASQFKLFDDQIDADALLSRCTDLQLSTQGLARVFAERARDIATHENLNGRPIEAYIRLAKDQ